MGEIRSKSELLKRLKSVLFKQRLILFTAGLLTTITVVIATFLALSLLARVVILPVWVKVPLLVLVAGSWLYLFGKFALSRLFDGTVDSVAVRLEEKYPALQGRLIAAVQFARMKKTPGYSSELIALTEQQALREAGLVNFNEVVSFHPVLKTGRFFLVAGVLAFLIVFLMPGLISYSFEVYSHPTTQIAPPLGYSVIPVPGSTEWVKYRDIDIGAAIVGERLPKRATINYRLVGGNWQHADILLREKEHHPTDAGDSVFAAITLKRITRSFDYYIEAGRVKTEIQKVDVVDRPRVTGIKLSIFYPEYTGLAPTVIDENNGSFSALVGSRVNMEIETNLPVETAELIFDDSSRVPLAVTNKKAETSLRVQTSRSYHIRLTDHLGEQNPDPIEYYITAVPDEYPTIDVLRPGFNVNLNDDMMLPLKVRIFDDFGFSSLVLKYTVVSHGESSEEHVAVLHFSDRIKTEGEIEFNWDMEPLHLYPGDYVIYYFEVADNDVISGPKVTRSRQYLARLPSLDEIIAETDADNTQRIIKTEELYKQGKELAKRLKNVARKLRAESKMSSKAEWQQQKELESIADKNAELVKKIEQMSREMEKSVDKLMENSLLSREIMEKLAQIQKLFEEVATPEMKEAQRRLMEALKNMDPNELQKAIQDFEMSQKELLERLDRTLALLKLMQLQQKIEMMVRKAEQLVQQQKEMNEKTAAAPKKSLPKLAKPEDELRSSLEDLKKETEQIKQLAKEASMETAPEVQKFCEAVEKNDAGESMAEMSKALSSSQKSQASKEGKVALSKLSEMLDQMQQQLLALKGADKEKIEKEMKRAIDDANYLSRKQEELLKKAATINPQSVVLRELAASQQDLISSCSGLKNRISELGKKSPFIAAELQKLISDAISQMEQAKEGFDIKKGREAIRNQQNAMVNLNRSALRMMESLEQQKQCDKGGNCDKKLSKLQSLCNKQNNLNQKTKQCNNPSASCNNPGSANNEELQLSREGLKRLASEQQGIRKSLQQLSEEFGNSRQILGRLDEIAQEMKKVEEDLADGEIGEETLQRQLQIYSRMLQATRSLQRKDFSNQRQAKTAEEQPYYVPPALPAELLNEKVNLEDRLRKFLGDSYPPQYEEQIKAYFKALLQVESAPAQTPNPSPEP